MPNQKKANRKPRPSKKIHDAVSSFKKQQPEYVQSLNLPEKISDKEFLKTILEKLKNSQERKLLKENPKFPFSTYELVPRFEALLQEKTFFIRKDTTIAHVEKKRIESTNSVTILSSTNPSTLPTLFLQSLNPIPNKATWPIELKLYIETLSNTYRFRIDSYSFLENSLPTFPPITLSPLNVFTFLSMGKESLWSLSKTIENTSYNKIIVVFVHGASFGGRDREREKFRSFKDWFVENKVDSRVLFFELDYDK